MPDTIANVFEGDLFSVASLTSYINSQPYLPHELGDWFTWNAQGELGASLVIEYKAGSLTLIPEAPRRSKGDTPDRDDRGAFSLMIPHYPQTDTLWSDQVGGVRAFGSALQLETVEQKRNEILDKMHRRNLLMHEFGRAGAVQGVLYKANGNVSIDWFDKFGVTRNTHDIDFATATTEIVAELTEAKEQSEDELGDLAPAGYTLVCGKNVFRKITTHATVKTAFDRWNQGAFMRDDMRKGFAISSDINVVSYSRGKIKVGDQWVHFIDPDESYLVPHADGLFQTRFAPGTGMQDINTLGLPEYVSPYILPHDEGVELKGQTNFVSWAERPRAIVRIKQSA